MGVLSCSGIANVLDHKSLKPQNAKSEAYRKIPLLRHICRVHSRPYVRELYMYPFTVSGIHVCDL